MVNLNSLNRIAFLLILLAFNVSSAEQKPKLNEVVDLLKSKLTVVKPEQIEEAALDGILSKFSNLVEIVYDEKPSRTVEPIRKSVILETNFAYFHIQQVGPKLASQFKTALGELEKSNVIKGVIIDLRFASGNDYSACGEFLDLFFDTEKTLFSIGNRAFKSTQKEKQVKTPITVLINRETATAAEVIAEVLRQNKVAVLIGSKTSGNTYSFEEFKLSTGQMMKIAMGTIRLSDDTIISTNGILPDISVDVSLDEEREFILNPYKLPRRLMAESSETGAVRPLRKINEAELVRMKREGIDPATGAQSTDREKTSKPQQELQLIHDPSLARALDLLKVLAEFNFEKFQR